MPAVEIFTWQDAIDSLVHSLGGAGTEKLRFGIRNAIARAYQDLVAAHPWRYFNRQLTVQLVAPQSSSTITYTSSSRALTLASGTWPSWATYGHVRVGDVTAQVASRDSDTVLTMDPVNTFSANIAAGTSYTIFRNIYTLPTDFISLHAPIAESTGWCGEYIQPKDWHFQERHDATSGDPQAWTIMGDPNLMGSFCIAVWPYPSAAKTYQAMYQCAGRPLRYSGYAANDFVGTVSGTVDTAAITGSSTVFAAAHVGSIIRFGDTTNLPTGNYGLNPFVEQKVIFSRSSATAIVVDSDLDTTLSAGTKYVISDMIDLPPRMITAMLRWAEYELNAHADKKTWSAAYQRFKDALIRAKEADVVYSGTRIMGGPGVDGPYDEPIDNAYLST